MCTYTLAYTHVHIHVHTRTQTHHSSHGSIHTHRLSSHVYLPKSTHVRSAHSTSCEKIDTECIPSKGDPGYMPCNRVKTCTAVSGITEPLSADNVCGEFDASYGTMVSGYMYIFHHFGHSDFDVLHLAHIKNMHEHYTQHTHNIPSAAALDYCISASDASLKCTFCKDESAEFITRHSVAPDFRCPETDVPSKMDWCYDFADRCTACVSIV